jgi:hypothetical protein
MSVHYVVQSTACIEHLGINHTVSWFCALTLGTNFIEQRGLKIDSSVELLRFHSWITMQGRVASEIVIQLPPLIYVLQMKGTFYWKAAVYRV